MSENAFERILTGLERNGSRVTPRGRGKVSAQCPAHEDRNPSLSVTAIEGSVLVHCHGPCTTTDVLTALGLDEKALYDNPRGDTLTSYAYPNRTVYRKVGKEFPQTGDLNRFELYHLDRLEAATEGGVFLVEGEKDVHAIEAIGGIATTSPQGSKSFHKVDVAPLAGRHVTAVVDRDGAGAGWAASVKAKLGNVAAGLRFVQARTGKDAADHIAAGHELTDWEPFDFPDQPADDEEESTPSFLDRLRAALVDTDGLDSIPDPEPLVGEDILFRDSLVWMVGKPGCMKSFTALDIAGCVGTGEPWQGYKASQGKVLFLVAEGVRGTKKRVRAWEKSMGRPMTGVQFLPVAVQSAVPNQWDAFVALARELAPSLIVIDTQARVTVGVDENSNTEMGGFVHQAERLRVATGACVIIVHHIGRTGDTGRGATTLDGAMSTIFKVSKVKGEDRVTLECTKNKDGEEWDDIRLRVVPMGESIVLVTDDGRPSADRNGLAGRKWVHDWWAVHKDEPVSISVLVKSDVVTEPTFHRSKRDLIDQGLAVKEGTGNATRYRLTSDPALR